MSTTLFRVFAPDLVQDATVIAASPATETGGDIENIRDQTKANHAIWSDLGAGDKYVQVEWNIAPLVNSVLVAFCRFDLLVLSNLRVRVVWDTTSAFAASTYWPGPGATDWQSWIIEGAGSNNYRQFANYDGALDDAIAQRVNKSSLLHTYVDSPTFPANVEQRFLRVYVSTAEVSPPASSLVKLGWVCPVYAYYGDLFSGDLTSLGISLEGGVPSVVTRGGVWAGETKATYRGREIMLHRVHEVLARRVFMEYFANTLGQGRLGVLERPDRPQWFHQGGFGVYTFDGAPQMLNPIHDPSGGGFYLYNVRLKLKETG